MKKSSGFTLVELLIVISVVATLLLVTVPIGSNLISTQQFNSTVKTILSDLKFAQSRAVTGRSEVAVEFNRGSASYVISQLDLFSGKFILNREVRLYKKLSFQKDRTIRFSRTGFPPPGGSGTVMIEGSSGKQKKVIVSSVGRIRIQ